MQIQIGDRVRSFDFARDRDCYVEGVVEGFDMDGSRYRIRIENKVWLNEADAGPFDEYACPPVNGSPCLGGGVTAFVELM